MRLIEAMTTVLAPALCSACGRHCPGEMVVCRYCLRRLSSAAPLNGAGPAGADRAWSSAPYEGVSRELVAALKFGTLLPVADLMAERIAWLAPAEVLSGELVPVPTARSRTIRRGFDPADALASALADTSGLSLSRCLARRGGSRQVGRRRGERLERPPEILARTPAPRSAVIVDDVMTTGSTASAAARALRAAGAVRVVVVTFARRL